MRLLHSRDTSVQAAKPPPPVETRIFLSYRRDDSAAYALLLYESLRARFGNNVFMDIETLSPGLDFMDAIQHTLDQCDVMLALIGSHWASATDAAGRRRLENPEDLVRLEIESALARDVRVVPVLVGRAVMPGTQELPGELVHLARRHAFELSDVRWQTDTQSLIDSIDLAPNQVQQSIPKIRSAGRRVALWLSVFALLMVTVVILLFVSGSGEPPISTTTIPVGKSPDAIAINPDGRTAYVAEGGAGVTPIDASTGTTGPSIAVGEGPSAIAITPDGTTAYVANYNFDRRGTVASINLDTHTTGSSTTVGTGPDAIAITPDGSTAYVANFSDNTVIPIDLNTGAAGGPIAVGVKPFAIAITPDGKTAYVANYGDDTVTPINLGTGATGMPIAVGNGPDAIAIAPNGETAYVADTNDNSVMPIDLSTDKTGESIDTGKGPSAIAILPTGTTAYVANFYGNTVTPIDLRTGMPSPPISVGRHPFAIAITPAGTTAYVANQQDDTVTRIRIKSGG